MSVDLFSALFVKGGCLMLDDGILNTSSHDVCQILVVSVIGYVQRFSEALVVTSHCA